MSSLHHALESLYNDECWYSNESKSLWTNYKDSQTGNTVAHHSVICEQNQQQVKSLIKIALDAPHLFIHNNHLGLKPMDRLNENNNQKLAGLNFNKKSSIKGLADKIIKEFDHNEDVFMEFFRGSLKWINTLKTTEEFKNKWSLRNIDEVKDIIKIVFNSNNNEPKIAFVDLIPNYTYVNLIVQIAKTINFNTSLKTVLKRKKDTFITFNLTIIDLSKRKKNLKVDYYPGTGYDHVTFFLELMKDNTLFAIFPPEDRYYQIPEYAYSKVKFLYNSEKIEQTLNQETTIVESILQS